MPLGISTPKGLQRLTLRGTVALSTLADVTAIAIAALDNFTQPFLVKKIKGMISITGLAVHESAEIVLGRHDSSLAEIQDALQLTNVDPVADPNAYQIEQTEAVKHVWWETRRSFRQGTGLGMVVVHIEQSMGGGKGIPIQESNGVRAYAFNGTDGAVLTTGAIAAVNLELLGVWL